MVYMVVPVACKMAIIQQTVFLQCPYTPSVLSTVSFAVSATITNAISNATAMYCNY